MVRLLAEGRSTPKGMFIQIILCNHQERRCRIFFTPQAEEGNQQINKEWKRTFWLRLILSIAILVGLAIWSSGGYYYFHHHQPPLWMSGLASVAMFAVIHKIFFWLFVLSNRPVRRWHACEHKLLFLLRNEQSINLESLKIAPAESKTCGSVPPIIRVVTAVTFLSLFPWVPIQFALLITFLVFVVISCFTPVVFFVQRQLFLSPPTEAEYNETIKLSKEIKAWIESQITESKIEL